MKTFCLCLVYVEDPELWFDDIYEFTICLN